MLMGGLQVSADGGCAAPVPITAPYYGSLCRVQDANHPYGIAVQAASCLTCSHMCTDTPWSQKQVQAYVCSPAHVSI